MSEKIGQPTVSIDARARGATDLLPQRDGAEGFQSTPPRGGRHEPSQRRPAARPVSIHAPARGATLRGRTTGRSRIVSIHAPARGATSSQIRARRNTMSFNPRPRAGGDIVAFAEHRLSLGFNPRPRAGGDADVDAMGELFVVSIHAPARGATPFPCSEHSDTEFQSTPPRGGQPPTDPRRRRTFPVSIHAPARGATKNIMRAPPNSLVSIHAPARGATPISLF